MKWLHALRKLLLGLALRCPNCGRGRMFSGLFRMNPTCPNCGVRYERLSGESIGGTLINLSVAEVLTMGGFIATKLLFDPPLAFQLTFWVGFNILFIILFYRHARALWVSITYLAGGLYTDAEYERQQQAKRKS